MANDSSDEPEDADESFRIMRRLSGRDAKRARYSPPAAGKSPSVDACRAFIPHVLPLIALPSKPMCNDDNLDGLMSDVRASLD
jgi:hypothetical protein